jgi:hypothetical protein
MARACGLSVSTVQRIWRALGRQPRRLQTFRLSTAPIPSLRFATLSASTWFRAYRESNPNILVVQPPRTGRQRMVPASWTAREAGASFSKDQCVLISL